MLRDRGFVQSSARSSAQSFIQSSTRSSTYRGFARGFARNSAYRGSTQSFASGPRYIPDGLYACLCQDTPYIHPGSHLYFYPSLYPPYLGRHQDDSQQTTVARARRPSPSPDDRRRSQMTVARAR